MSWDQRWLFPGVVALYVHVPFCARKCGYCDFASWATERHDPLMRDYATAIACQVEELASTGVLAGASTAYFGGGTPTLLGQGLPRLVAQVVRSCGGLQEVTSEANPDSLTPDLIEGLREAGATRLSIGVQSTDDHELRLLGRLHDSATAKERVRDAVASGLDVSCDLMCAIPGQTSGSWSHSLHDVISWGPSHISVYPLQIEDGTPFAADYGQDPSWNAEDRQADYMEEALMLLKDAQFRRYEVSSYARRGKQCKHNLAYWTGLPYLGLGTDAAGMLTREAYQRLQAACPQLPALPRKAFRIRTRVLDGRSRLAGRRDLSQLSFRLEFLSAAQAAAEDLMLGARLTSGIGAELIAAASEVLGEGRVAAQLSTLVSEGLLKQCGKAYVPTKSGWLLGNELFGALWDLAEDQRTQTMEVRP